MIHRIYSTLSTFKTLDFKPGLNVLLAQKADGATSEQTRNRAGKTSLTEIVNFLLGADAGPDSLMRSKALVDSTFGMEFDLGETRVLIERSGANKSKLQIAEVNSVTKKTSITNSEWIDRLSTTVFSLPSIKSDKGRVPTFRSLIAYFIRRQLSGGYSTPEKQATMQQTADFQIALMFLMGLDWHIAHDWQLVRDREKTLEELKKAAGTGVLGSIIGKAADLRTQLTVAEARLKKLQAEVEQFHVLPQYEEMEAEASKLTRALNDLANGNTVDLSSIQDLELALKSEEAPSMTDLQTVFQEAGVILQLFVIDVTTWQENLKRQSLAWKLEINKSLD
jgi:uncharacterized protein YydD (DUF2326 family)